MNVDLQELLSQTDKWPMDGITIHKGRRMTNDEIRIACNYGLKQGYETGQEIPKEVVDKICDPYCDDFNRSEYDNAPDYYSLEYIAASLHRVQNCYNVDWDADDIMDKLKEEL